MLEAIINLLFPQVCGICGKLDENWICENCIKKINSIKKDKIIDVFQKDYEKLIYVFNYKDIREKILNYKFNDEAYLSNMFSNIIIKDKKIVEELKKYDVILPVPMTKRKKRNRGYNQTELIVEKISKKLNIEYNPNLFEKIRNNKTQSSLNKNQRKKNIDGVFRVNDKNEIFGKNIILFDDIVTTGATIDECSKVLKKAGAKSILVLALAKD